MLYSKYKVYLYLYSYSYSIDNYSLFLGLVFLPYLSRMQLCECISLLIVYIISSYGFCTIPIRFDASLLWPRSVLDFFSNLGVAPYTLGYNFCFLTYYVFSIIIQIIQ